MTTERTSEITTYGHLRIERENCNGKLLAKAWRGKATNHYAYFSFKNADDRESWINRQIEGDAARAKMMADRKVAKAERKAQMLQTIKVGTILHGSWGYDQTNCELYEVTAVKGCKVTIRPVAHQRVEGTEGFMCQDVRPVPGQYTGEPMTRLVTASGIKLNDHCDLSPTDLTAKHYSSWYA